MHYNSTETFTGDFHGFFLDNFARTRKKLVNNLKQPALFLKHVSHFDSFSLYLYVL